MGGEEEICGLGYLIEDSLAYFLNLAVFVLAGRVVERITAFGMRSEDDRDVLIDPRLGAMARRVIGVKYSSLKYGYGGVGARMTGVAFKRRGGRKAVVVYFLNL